jgi:hypothetical protein
MAIDRVGRTARSSCSRSGSSSRALASFRSAVSEGRCLFADAAPALASFRIKSRKSRTLASRELSHSIRDFSPSSGCDAATAACTQRRTSFFAKLTR